jgi:peptidoglycan/LPS O-acetylase OafA/YrhL
VLANRRLAWLGLISYGVFLWHLPIAVKLSGKGAVDWLPLGGFLSLSVLTAAVAIPCAAASYYLLERPVLRFK